MSRYLPRHLAAWPAALAVCFAACATAEPRGDASADMAATESAAPEAVDPVAIEGFKTDRLTPETSRAIEEIVVFGYRKPRVEAPNPKLFEDPLRLRVMKEIRELRLLDGEFEWRTETADLSIEPPRLRVGYDPRSDDRLPELSPQVRLPIDQVRPATLLSVDF